MWVDDHICFSGWRNLESQAWQVFVEESQHLPYRVLLSGRQDENSMAQAASTPSAMSST
jgi:hypothetical protein